MSLIDAGNGLISLRQALELIERRTEDGPLYSEVGKAILNGAISIRADNGWKSIGQIAWRPPSDHIPWAPMTVVSPDLVKSWAEAPDFRFEWRWDRGDIFFSVGGRPDSYVTLINVHISRVEFDDWVETYLSENYERIESSEPSDDAPRPGRPPKMDGWALAALAIGELMISRELDRKHFPTNRSLIEEIQKGVAGRENPLGDKALEPFVSKIFHLLSELYEPGD